MEKQVSVQRGKQLEALINGSADAILSIDAEGIIKFANEGACQLTGRTLNELIGESIVEVYGSIESARAANRKIFRAGGTIQNMETSIKNKSGKMVPVQVSASHLYDSSGKYIGGVGYFLQYKPVSATEAQVKASLEQIEETLESLQMMARSGIRSVSRTVSNIISTSGNIINKKN
jgi:PAS domain S-box-containing protein